MELANLCPETLPDRLDLPHEVFVGAGAVESLPDVMARYLGDKVLSVADPDTWTASRGITGFSTLFPQGDPDHLLGRNPHADDATVDQTLLAAGSASGVLAIGSGTINDIAKLASARLKLPYAVVGTAASMNGYVSSVAAILSAGLKTSVPARPPRALVMDTDLLGAAPPELTQAGLGDLLCHPISSADWWLSDQIEQSGFTALPGRLVDPSYHDAVSQAAGLRTGDPAAFEALVKALILSGLAMVVAGGSQPASGGEHLLSHMWEMEDLAAGRPTRLHGAQIGVATCISAALYQHVVALDSPRFTKPPTWADEANRIRADHGSLAESVLEPARKKHARASARIAVLRKRWPEIRDGLIAINLPTPADLRATLAAAGAPHTLADLGLTQAVAARTLRLARDVRDRLTVLDLAFELGLLPEAAGDIVN